jgi:hypothetical protein
MNKIESAFMTLGVGVLVWYFLNIIVDVTETFWIFAVLCIYMLMGIITRWLFGIVFLSNKNNVRGKNDATY